MLLVAGPVALLARLGGLPWPAALVLGAVVSSTDAAATFAVLRASGLQLKRRVAATLEVESGINDPVAVILTTVLTANLLRPGQRVWADSGRDRGSARGRRRRGAGAGYGGRPLLPGSSCRAAASIR